MDAELNPDNLATARCVLCRQAVGVIAYGNKNSILTVDLPPVNGGYYRLDHTVNRLYPAILGDAPEGRYNAHICPRGRP